VDSGNTHNFLNLKKAKISRIFKQVIKVKIANGEVLTSEGKCIYVSVQGNIFCSEFFVLTLVGGCDVVLGVQWLRTLGPIIWDFFEVKNVLFLEGVCWFY
jgi:hypothetical protein